ncbi:MAG TPA: hypothetical protein DDW65_23415 [Firmicutes bacterium]|jgi:hypothetical protein|nr:hypothetical protein [Bacillota bacterium]
MNNCEDACKSAKIENPGCCSSCHEDAEKFGIGLTDVNLNGQSYSVCCDVANAIEKHEKMSQK